MTGVQTCALPICATRPGAALVYATSSVSDLSAARHYYEQVIGLDIGPLEQLHGPEHEAMWGLAGAAHRIYRPRRWRWH